MTKKRYAGLSPLGIGRTKPHHILDIFRTAWENRDNLGFAYRILRDGVCDGCALGTTGMKDMTMKGIHLCNVRLALLRLNTMPAIDLQRFSKPEILEKMTEKELRDLGRLSHPMLREKGSRQFKKITWEEALTRIASKLSSVSPERYALYLTSRGLTNESYYVAQKFARFLGTNNVDNAARLCHSPSTTGLKSTIGVGASTCSYKDWLETDVLVFIGSNAPNNQPVTTKYLHYAKKNGAKIIVLNTFKEPGLDKYWIPSVFESAVFGSQLADEFFYVHTGGDLAFLHGALKSLLEKDELDHTFIEKRTEGFSELRAHLEGLAWEDIELSSGASKAAIEDFAAIIAKADRGIFIWSMGITQHPHGVENVQAIVNLALSQGMVGRDGCGLTPIRGHSGVQGGAECGAVPTSLPGGKPLNQENKDLYEEMWGFPIPEHKGLTTFDMLTSAQAGDLEVLHCVGGNFLGTIPDPEQARQAMENIPFRIHQDIILSPQMFVPSSEDVILLPSQTRYEQKGGGTETSTERMIYFSPEIPGRRIGESKSEWEIFLDIAKATKPESYSLLHFENAGEIRQEIATAVPFYKGIENLSAKGDVMQYGGRHLCKDGVFPLANTLAKFTTCNLPDLELQASNEFLLGTRRGKQFNSMIHRNVDPLTGAKRDAVFMNEHDAKELGLSEGDAVLLKNDMGQYRGKVKISTIRKRNLQVHWPEGNVLLPFEKDPRSGIPLYSSKVEVLIPESRESVKK